MAGARTGKRRPADVAVYLFLVAVCALFLVPIFWIVSTSLKPTSEILITPTSLLPLHPTLDHYGAALAGDFRRKHRDERSPTQIKPAGFSRLRNTITLARNTDHTQKS